MDAPFVSHTNETGPSILMGLCGSQSPGDLHQLLSTCCEGVVALSPGQSRRWAGAAPSCVLGSSPFQCSCSLFLGLSS